MPRFTPEHWRTLEALFVAAGFHYVRQEGSHPSYIKAGATRPVVIPLRNRLIGYTPAQNRVAASRSDKDNAPGAKFHGPIQIVKTLSPQG